MNFECRRFRESDLPALIEFFRQCYGPETVFQDADFVRWYLSGAPDGGLESLVAVTDTGAVVAHYGGLPGELILRGRSVTLVWGVNAYTLLDWRSRGIGQRLVEIMMERYEVFGVIGFTPKTADFYDTAGFNVFGKHRFHRFALALHESIYEIAESIGLDRDEAKARFPLADVAGFAQPVEVQRMTSESATELDGLPMSSGATAKRDGEFLERRFLRNPFIRYAGFQLRTSAHTGGYIVARLERLFPTEHRALRIIDLRATPGCERALIEAAIRHGVQEGASYIDFSCMGPACDAAFAELSFTVLREDEVALLPQVTAPIEARPNQEFLGLFSRRYRDEIAALTEDDIYFTRADSDRDRIARLSQRAHQ